MCRRVQTLRQRLLLLQPTVGRTMQILPFTVSHRQHCHTPRYTKHTPFTHHFTAQQNTLQASNCYPSCTFKSTAGYYSTQLHSYFSIHTLRSSDQSILTIPHTAIGSRAVHIVPPHIWNSLSALHLRSPHILTSNELHFKVFFTS